MGNNWNKTSMIAILLSTLLILLVSCNQSCFQVITHNDVAYWSFNWTYNNPHGSIVEFSKKDSTMKYIDDVWAYEDWNPAFWGLKFRITNDTLLKYVNKKGFIMMYDTIPIVSYSKNTFISMNNESEQVKWHRISTKYAKRMIDLMNSPEQVKLSTLLNTRYQNESITDIVDVTWKLYGYGDVSTGMVRKSETLKQNWRNIIRFCNDCTMIGFSTGNSLCGLYVISGSNMDFLSFNSGEEKENYDGKELCDALPQCKRFKITNNWLQMFYDEDKKCLLFKASHTKVSQIGED